MNSVILIGRLTAKPEVAYTSANRPVTKFTIAVDRRNRDKGANFIRLTAFDKTAETICRYLDKGRQIAIRGRIETGSYQKDGQTIYTQDIIIDEFDFIGNKTEVEKRDNNSYHNYGGYSEEPTNYRRYEETSLF